MEDKLNELKEQYCKWYCSIKNNEFAIVCNKVKRYAIEDCEDCKNVDICDGDGCIDWCEICQVKEFIRFVVTDEIKK